VTDNSQNEPRAIRSFVRRAGRITPAQRNALCALDQQPGLTATGTISYAGTFGRDAPRWLEIGFGDGGALIHAATRHPEADIVGIEVHDPGVGRALMAIEAAKLTNVRVLHADAVTVLTQRIAPASLDRIMLFFPDPWHKKRHHKRRIVQPPFIELLASRLRLGGVFHAATDWEPYAEHMLEVLSSAPGLRNTGEPGGFASPSIRPYETKFERRGLRLGHGVWDLVFERAEAPLGVITPTPEALTREMPTPNPPIN
jgi:tRNA (guanine-N7-)-methyltransferase